MKFIPSIFIGSSVEGLGYAHAIQAELHYDAECTIWSQGVFSLSSGTLDALIDAASVTDFAIFVFSPDDVQNMRGGTHKSVRDNVLFEYGLFTGKLGKDCVFYLKPMDEDIHIPTALIGTTPGTYRANRSDGNMKAAVGPFCEEVRTVLKQWDPSTSEQSLGSVIEFFPGQWKNTWYLGEDKQGEEEFLIRDDNTFTVNGEPRFVIENIKINERKNYIKFVRRGTSEADNRRLSITLKPLNRDTREGTQSDGKRIVFTRI